MKALAIAIIIIAAIELYIFKWLLKPPTMPKYPPFKPDPEHLNRIREEYLSRRRPSYTADPRD